VTRIVHAQVAPVEVVPVEALDGVGGIALVKEANKAESARIASVAITWDVAIANLAVALKLASQRFGRRSVRQIVHFQRNHTIDIGRSTCSHACEGTALFYKFRN